MRSLRWSAAVPRALAAAGLVVAVSAARPADAADFVGAEACKTCHPAEYAQWKGTGHARALARLTPLQRRDRSCRGCHTLDPRPEPTAENADLAGVQCESCHGAGAAYSQRYVMRDRVLAKLLGLEDVKPETCARCHSGEGVSLKPFDYAAAVLRVSHGAKPAGR